MCPASLTLCCVDCVNLPLALRALRQSSAKMDFDEVLLLTDRDVEAPDIRVRRIRSLSSHAEYSDFMVKELLGYVQTSHVMVIQWDGYIVNPDAWTEEFLQFDYIGAPWEHFEAGHSVGNGGFSLRSRRLLEALSDPDICETHPEDVAICRTYRPLLESRYGIRFAPVDLARRFSFEASKPVDMPFGFHAIQNMGFVLTRFELEDLLKTLRPETVGSEQFLLLGLRYLWASRLDEAELVFERRLVEFPDDAMARRLLARVERKRARKAGGTTVPGLVSRLRSLFRPPKA